MPIFGGMMLYNHSTGVFLVWKEATKFTEALLCGDDTALSNWQVHFNYDDGQIEMTPRDDGEDIIIPFEDTIMIVRTILRIRRNLVIHEN